MSFIEHELVPFQAEILLGEKLLVLAPHPDDEVIGCGGLIALHIQERREVRTVLITDGGAANEPAGDAYLQKRRKESVAGLAILGSQEPKFLGIPDRLIGSRAEVLQKEIREQIIRYRPDLIVIPSPVEVHPDHLATARALHDLIQRSPEILGDLALCRLAFCEISQPFRPNVLVVITGVAEL